MQIWADGSCYQGEFVDDMRHGKGVHKWANQEVRNRGVFHIPANFSKSTDDR